MSAQLPIGSATLAYGAIDASYKNIGGTDICNVLRLTSTLDVSVIVSIPLDDGTTEEYTLAANTKVSLVREVSSYLQVRFATTAPTTGAFKVEYFLVKVDPFDTAFYTSELGQSLQLSTTPNTIVPIGGGFTDGTGIRSVNQKNLFNLNDKDVLLGYYLSSNGTPVSNKDYAVSGYMPVNPGMTIYQGGGTSASTSALRFLHTYDKNKTLLSSSENAGRTSYVVESSVKYIRVSYSVEDIASLQIIEGTFGGYSTPYEYPMGTFEGHAAAKIGMPAFRKRNFTLADGVIQEVKNFPCFIKNGFSMSFYGKFTSFPTTFEIGKGFDKYRGDWLKIDATNIYWMHYESSESTKATTAHGLTFSDFLKVSITIDDASVCHVMVNTLSGYFKTTFNWTFEANDTAFVQSTGAAFTGCYLTCASKKLQSPIWVFGDSYVGVDVKRWPYYLRDMGYFDYMLNGIAGQGSQNAFSDLVKCLKYGRPRYLVWALGMNDSNTTWTDYFARVQAVCTNFGITLIAATIPTVPTRDKEAIKTAVLASGLRYVDFYSAVNADSSGTWYAGYLDVDGVHPTSIGAAAMASQVLVNVPEMMQYTFGI